MQALEMNPLAIHLIVIALGGAIGVLGHPGAIGVTWEKALRDTPMPEVIADLVQKGIDHSPLVEHYPVTDYGAGDKLTIAWHQQCHRCPKEERAFFFRRTQVRVGSTMTFSFRPALVAPILPRDVAEKVPFDDLPDVLATFSVAPGSAEAATVRDTLSLCQAALRLDGEQACCATSLEGAVQSATHMLGGTTTDDGGDAGALWAAASAMRSTGMPHQPYVILAVTPLDGDRHVGCHIVPFPYAVYYCHMASALPTAAYRVSLLGVGGGGPPVTLAAICHLDTSDWDPAHPAFEMLHTQPGGVPVCHFMSYANLLFGEKKAVAAATR